MQIEQSTHTQNKMTREKIISELYCSAEFSSVLNKVIQAHLRDDLRQEVFKVICELPEEKLFSIYSSWQQSGLRYYAVRVLWNMIKSGKSQFALDYRRKYITDIVDCRDEVDSLMDRLSIQDNNAEASEAEYIVAMNNSIEKLPMYNKLLLEYYCENNFSTIKVANETGINQRSIRYNLAKTRDIIKQDIERQINELDLKVVNHDEY